MLVTGANCAGISLGKKRDAAVRLQIFLDSQLFGPGVIDGKPGEFTQKAIYAYNRSQGRDPDDVEAMHMLADLSVNHAYALAVVPNIARKYVNPNLPYSRQKQAKVSQMAYRSYLEFMAERYHTKIDFLKELNGKRNLSKLRPHRAGSGHNSYLWVPNVKPFLIENLKRGQSYPRNKIFASRTLIIDTHTKQIYIYEDGEPEVKPSGVVVLVENNPEENIYETQKLIAMLPTTPGRARFIHRGEWEVVNCVAWPVWRYDKSLLRTGRIGKEALMIPGGPNNPVGVVWAGLSKRGIGIHGTNNPRTIGRASSSGCYRLANWDAARLPSLISPGTKVIVR